MKNYLISTHFDLITDDGFIVDIKKIDEKKVVATIKIQNISDAFLGFVAKEEYILFNLKSTLAQLGIDAIKKGIVLNKSKKTAEVLVEIIAYTPLAQKMLCLLSKDNYIGKLFCEEISRKVRDPSYLTRMFSRKDRFNRPLLSFNKKDQKDLILEKKEGYTIAFLPIQNGKLSYTKEIENFLPALSKILSYQNYPTRELLKLYQRFDKNKPANIQKDDCLLVKTDPLYIRTVFAKVSEK
nr:hypothetical protein [Candidatus Anoxychlamydiales bacterium]